MRWNIYSLRAAILVCLFSAVMSAQSSSSMTMSGQSLPLAAMRAQGPRSIMQAEGASRPVSAEVQQESAKNERSEQPPSDPREIVRRSVEVDHHNFERAKNYTCTQREVLKHLDKHGSVKSTETKTWDINFYYGEEYARLVQLDDKPLSAKEQQKEEEKLDKFLAKRKKEDEQDREKRRAKEEKDRQEGRAFVRDVANAYDFRLVGSERVSGEDTWVIEATPRPDFKPTQPHADILKKVKGRIWIEKKDYNWVKVEAEAIDTISFGLFLFRIHPGSHFVLETTHVNNELWALKRLYINGGARVALLKNEFAEQEDVFSNYKKFSTSITILPGVREVPGEEKPPPKQ
jgi:hypothetical protein